jgi:hypothetical protein
MLLQFGFIAMMVLVIVGAVARSEWQDRREQAELDALRHQVDATHGEMAVTNGEEA